MEVLNEIFDLFAELDATEEQLDFPIFTAPPSRAGSPSTKRPERQHGALFDLVLRHVPPPRVGGGHFRMLATTSRRTRISAVSSRAASRTASRKPNMAVKAISREGKLIEAGPRLEGAGLPRP